MIVQGRWMAGLAALALLAACAQKPKPETPTPEAVEAAALPPTVTRGEFLIEADKNDTWNAVGQIVVNTAGAEYEGRSQMLDMYTIRYRGVEFLVLTKAMLLNDTIKRTTTRVTATTPDGKPIDTNASADLLALLESKLPAAIEDVQARFKAEAEAKKKAASKSKSKSKGKKKKKK
jgi:hypothetical protein